MTKQPANRVVLALHIVLVVLVALATYIGTATNSLPHSWAPILGYVIVMLGLLAAVTTAVIKFLDGSQKSEALVAGTAATVMSARQARNTAFGEAAKPVGILANTGPSQSGQDEGAAMRALTPDPPDLEQGPSPADFAGDEIDKEQWLANRAPAGGE